MWSSIQTIHRPESLSEAWALHRTHSAQLLGGGTHQLAKRDPTVTELIRIDHLLSNKLHLQLDRITIAAGATLESIIRGTNDREDLSSLQEAIKGSCFSRHIRNQRTLGGEIANQAGESDLITYLLAAGAVLTVNKKEADQIRLTDWDGIGIVSSVTWNLDQPVVFNRISLLPSSPSLVSAAGRIVSGEWQLAIGGQVDRHWFGTTTEDIHLDKVTENITELAIPNFIPGITGGHESQRLWIQHSLRSLGEAE